MRHAILIATILWLILGMGGGASAAQSEGNPFPYRDSLAREIQFWKAVFTRYHQNEFLIHDARYPWLIYQVVRLDSSLSERERQSALRAIRRSWRFFLQELQRKIARGDTLNLSAEQQRVREMFRQLPATYSPAKAARVVRAQSGIREQFVAGLRRSFRYLPYIEAVMEEFGLPSALKYLPQMESTFHPAAVSHVGAAGMWQFMRSTARRYMRVNALVDERFDPFISTRAAARLLKYNYQKLGDWALAITAYNHGLSGIMRAVRRYGRNYLAIRENYLRRSFGFASRNFYPEFLAVVEIMDSLEYYFPGLKALPPLKFIELELAQPVRIPAFLQNTRIPEQVFRELNPAFRRHVWQGRRAVPEGYRLRLPVATDLAAVERVVSGQQVGTRLARQSQHKSDIAVQEIPDVPGRNLFASVGAHSLSIAATPVLLSWPKAGVEPGFPHREQTSFLLEPGQDVLAASASERGSAGMAFLQNGDAALHSPGEGTPAGSEQTSPAHLISAGEGVAHSPAPLWDKPRPVVWNQLVLRLREQLRPRGGWVTVWPEETVGHFAEWLQLPAYQIRRLNGLRRGETIWAGQRLRMDFALVSPSEFLRRRVQFHLRLLSHHFPVHQPIFLTPHVVRPGESLWEISERTYKIPANILLYFNDLDKLNQLLPGDVVLVPITKNESLIQ